MNNWTEEELEAKLKENPELKVYQGNPLPRLAPLLAKGNKYHAQRTYSELCQMTFDSKAEARRGEELWYLQKAGQIEKLEYQVKYELCDKPKITVTIDFKYAENGRFVLEDVKGILTRDSRTKYAWLHKQYGIEVKLSK